MQGARGFATDIITTCRPIAAIFRAVAPYAHSVDFGHPLHMSNNFTFRQLKSTALQVCPVLGQFSPNSAIVSKRDRASPSEQGSEGEFHCAQCGDGGSWLRAVRSLQSGDSRWRRLRGCVPGQINLWMRHTEKTDRDFLIFTHGVHPFPLPI
jgi:hypothetical protein